MEFRLLRPEEVIDRWGELAPLLDKAIAYCGGEIEVEDIRKSILGGREFLFAGFDEQGNIDIAATVEFQLFPKKTVLLLGYCGGKIGRMSEEYFEKIVDFAKRGGATALRTFCSNPAMVRLHQRYFSPKVAYTVLEKQI